MSDTESMVRLMENAAEHLRLALSAMTNTLGNSTDMKIVAAMAYGRAVLQMVAASVAPEGRAQINSVVERLRTDYASWAEDNDGVAMTDGEIASIAKFIRS